MTLTLPPPLEFALVEQARRRGIAPETLAVDVLRRHLLSITPPTPTDEWERRLFGAAVASVLGRLANTADYTRRGTG